MTLPRESDLVEVGKVVRTQGVRGKIKVFSYRESAEDFLSLEVLYLRDEAGRIWTGDVERVQLHKSSVLVKIKGIDSIDEATELVGRTALIPREELPALEDGEYYWFDLLGMEVVTEEGAALGRIDSILETGSNDVYVVHGSGGERLIPAIRDVIREVDTKRKRMTVRVLEGLFEDNEI
ncbi:ribosome maturation factor RimM [Thermodesulfobacteriota bacterium]